MICDLFDEYLAEQEIIQRKTITKETELWRNLDRLRNVGVAVSRSRKALENQLVWSCSCTDHLEFIHRRIDAIARAA